MEEYEQKNVKTEELKETKLKKKVWCFLSVVAKAFDFLPVKLPFLITKININKKNIYKY